MTAPFVTFAAFRVNVAIELRDGMILTATAGSDGGGFTDQTNLTDSPDQYKASHGIVISAVNGANVGKLLRVEASSPQSGRLTFAAALPAAVTTGDVLHLFNLGGYGFRPQMYDHAITNALEASYPDFVTEAVVAGATPFDADTPVIAVPDSLVAVYAIELDDDDEDWRTIPPARRPGRWGNGWSLDRGNRELRIDGCWRDEADGLAYRLRGYGAHPIPTLAASPITIDLLWLMTEVKARLAARRGTDRQWQQWAVEWGRMAQEQRARIMTPREANTEWL